MARQDFPSARLDAAGLNLQAVFDIADLPSSCRDKLGDTAGFRQLILLAHGGRALWSAVMASAIASPDPIDDFTVATVARWFAEELPGHRHAVVYPGPVGIGLQALGELAGWHHPSPFMVGINARWGSWYAYRAVLLADTDFPPSRRVASPSPCLDCRDRPCIDACPGDALAGGAFSLAACIAWRKHPDSSCRAGCQARMACPVAAEHRYSSEQMSHSYGISQRMIERDY